MKNEGKVEGNKKKIVALAVALLLLVGGTYAWLTITLNGTKTARIEAGTLSLELDNESAAINITDGMPKSDADGQTQDEKYTFTLNNNGNITSEYTVFLDSQAVTGTPMPQNRVKYAITKTVKSIVGVRDSLNSDGDEADTVVTSTTTVVDAYGVADTFATEKALDSGKLAAGNYIEYELRLWVDENASTDEMKDAEFGGKLRITAQQEGIEEDAAYPTTP